MKLGTEWGPKINVGCNYSGSILSMILIVKSGLVNPAVTCILQFDTIVTVATKATSFWPNLFCDIEPKDKGKNPFW